jgi:hypothetical protein
MAGAIEQGLPFWRTVGTIFRGWVMVQNGDTVEGMSLLRSGLVAFRATGAEMWMPYQVALLAAACEITGQIEEGMTPVGRYIVEQTGER